jgi:hypothetical protein
MQYSQVRTGVYANSPVHSLVWATPLCCRLRCFACCVLASTSLFDLLVCCNAQRRVACEMTYMLHC